MFLLADALWKLDLKGVSTTAGHRDMSSLETKALEFLNATHAASEPVEDGMVKSNLVEVWLQFSIDFHWAQARVVSI